ncbi:MAG: ribosomal protein S18-alanine N-acetyltransferase [Defluviitaleaceae bacterium]|nr:ribosomal protein S18-alanine N-acetyltransferase [Defluviitaleaceae bacterium]
MQPRHVDAVCEIENDSFSVPWSRESIVGDYVNNARSAYFVALDEEDLVVGYASVWHVVNEGHIINVAVDRRHRRRGAGSLLIERLVSFAAEKEMIGLTLEVRVGNREAMGLYHKYGFAVEGLRKNYYSDTGEDAVIMWKRLPAPQTNQG